MSLSFASSLIDQLFNDADITALIENCDAVLNDGYLIPLTESPINRNTSKFSNQSIDMLIADGSDTDESERLLEAV